jgi:Ca2+-binding RTX toxin-like protein
MSKPTSNADVLHYQADGTWTGYDSWNAGDPLGHGTGNLVPLAGYAQTDANYVGVQGGSTLAMGNGHEALFLDDNISPGFNGGARLQNISAIKLGTGDQLVDLTSTSYSLDVATITGGNGNDIILNSDGNTAIHTGSGNTYVWTGNGNDTVYGGHGADTIAVGTGNDVIHGGSGFSTVDFSALNGKLTIDLGAHTATIADPTTGVTTATDQLFSIEKVVGDNAGMFLDTGNKSGIVGVGGTGNDTFHIEGTNDTLTGGGGDNTYEWTRKFVAAQAANGAATEITDFHVGQDTLNLANFLKGQGIKNASYDQVVHLNDTAQGTMVNVLAGGQWHQLAMLDNVHNTTVDALTQHLVPLAT